MQGNVLSPLVDPSTRSNRVTSAVREAILSGSLRPGETLIERQLAQMLGVSKTPVREALISLTSSGLVVSSPNRGVTVRELTATDVIEINEVRLLLEPWAIGRTAQQASDHTVGRVRAALSKIEALLTDESADSLDSSWPPNLSLANRAFHRELYSGCGNGLVVKRLDELQDLTALSTIGVLWEQWPTWRAEYLEHCRIFGMLESRDYVSVEKFAREHIQNSVTRLSGPLFSEPSVPPKRQVS